MAKFHAQHLVADVVVRITAVDAEGDKGPCDLRMPSASEGGGNALLERSAVSQCGLMKRAPLWRFHPRRASSIARIGGIWSPDDLWYRRPASTLLRQHQFAGKPLPRSCRTYADTGRWCRRSRSSSHPQGRGLIAFHRPPSEHLRREWAGRLLQGS